MKSEAPAACSGGLDFERGSRNRVDQRGDVVVDGVIEDDALLGYVSDAFSQLSLAELVVGGSADGEFARRWV